MGNLKGRVLRNTQIKSGKWGDDESGDRGEEIKRSLGEPWVDKIFSSGRTNGNILLKRTKRSFDAIADMFHKIV